MRSKTIALINLKSGYSVPLGTECDVTVPNRSEPMIAKVDVLAEDGSIDKSFLIPSALLWKRFYGFQEFTQDDLQDTLFDSTCVSLTGDTVEPDGWDSEGFPSILLACGLM